MSITIIFAPPRAGKTALMTKFLSDEMFNYERIKACRGEIARLNLSGFKYTYPDYVVASNYNIEAHKFGYTPRRAMRINPYRLGFVNNNVYTHFLPPFCCVGIMEAQKYFNSRLSDEEKTAINNLIKRNPDIGLNELYGKLCKNYGYKRNYVTLYRYLRKSNILIIKKRKPYKPKPYITPMDIGEKWQLDVKFVPRECYSGVVYEKTYQYTVIDEASRKRYIRAYKEQSSFSTVDFVMRAFRFFGYKPKIIQTDNGQEFTFLKGETKDGRIHLFDKLCLKLGIEHKMIRPRTPRHNGKVERSHRTDNERFYKYLRYYNFNDLQTQMSRYLTRSNNIPSRVLRSRFNKNRWLSPNEKERELCGEII